MPSVARPCRDPTRSRLLRSVSDLRAMKGSDVGFNKRTIGDTLSRGHAGAVSGLSDDEYARRVGWSLAVIGSQPSPYGDSHRDSGADHDVWDLDGPVLDRLRSGRVYDPVVGAWADSPAAGRSARGAAAEALTWQSWAWVLLPLFVTLGVGLVLAVTALLVLS